MRRQAAVAAPRFPSDARQIPFMTVIATWNVNSVKARLPRVLEWLEAFKPDVVLLQELKTEERSTFAIRERFLAKMRCSKNGRIYPDFDTTHCNKSIESNS